MWLIFAFGLLAKLVIRKSVLLDDFNQLYSGLWGFVVTMKTFHTTQCQAHCLGLIIELVSVDVAILPCLLLRLQDVFKFGGAIKVGARHV